MGYYHVTIVRRVDYSGSPEAVIGRRVVGRMVQGNMIDNYIDVKMVPQQIWLNGLAKSILFGQRSKKTSPAKLVAIDRPARATGKSHWKQTRVWGVTLSLG